MHGWDGGSLASNLLSKTFSSNVLSFRETFYFCV